MTDTDKILSEVSPQTDQRLRTNRAGNPMEQAAAVAQSRLTDTEIMFLVQKAGVEAEYAGLSDKLRDLVEQGFSGLWQINTIGLSVEDGDKKIVGDRGGMQKIVEEDAEQTNVRFHGGVNQWFYESAAHLVQAAIAKDAKSLNDHKNRVKDGAGDYIARLVYVGADYKQWVTGLAGTSRETVENYLNGRRGSDLGTMKKTLFEKVTPALEGINPV